LGIPFLHSQRCMSTLLQCAEQHGQFAKAKAPSVETTPFCSMAHLLIIELPGGKDYDLVQAALDRGERFTFPSANLGHYREQDAVWTRLVQAQHLLEVHAKEPIDAVLCLLDIRLVEAA